MSAHVHSKKIFMGKLEGGGKRNGGERKKEDEQVKPSQTPPSTNSASSHSKNSFLSLRDNSENKKRRGEKRWCGGLRGGRWRRRAGHLLL